MEDIDNTKTKIEIEKIKEEIKELRRPFWAKANFISSVYLPIAILAISYFLNKDYINQSLELKSVQQQLKQIELDTVTKKLYKDSQNIATKEFEQKRRLDSINLRSKKVNSDYVQLSYSQKEYLLAERTLARNEKKLKVRESILQTEKIHLENKERILQDTLEAIGKRINFASNKSKLIARISGDVKRTIVRFSEDMLNTVFFHRLLADSSFADSQMKSILGVISDANKFSNQLGVSLDSMDEFTTFKKGIEHYFASIQKAGANYRLMGSNVDSKYLEEAQKGFTQFILERSVMMDGLLLKIEELKN